MRAFLQKIGMSTVAIAIIFLGVCFPAFAKHHLNLGSTGHETYGYNCDYWLSATAEDVRQWILDGGKVRARSKYDGAEALHMATMCSPNLAIIDLLVEAGADVNATDRYGQTPLHNVVAYNHFAGPELSYQMIIALVAHGANPNIRTDEGTIVLNRTERYHGFSSDIRTNGGVTPLDIVSSKIGYGSRIDLLHIEKFLSDPQEMRRQVKAYCHRYQGDILPEGCRDSQ